MIAKNRTNAQILYGTALVIAICLPLVVPSYYLFQTSQALVMAMAVVGLNILTGYSGQVSLSHNTFFAIGAYTVAYLMLFTGTPFVLALGIGTVLAGLAGILIGFPALRLRGLYLALLTLAISIVTPTIIRRADGLTGGSAGLRLRKLVFPDIGGSYDAWLYYSVLAGLVLIIIVALRITRSRLGDTLLSIKTNELASTALGVNIYFYKVFAFFISAAMAGFAGGFFAVVVGYLSPESFDLTFALALLTGSVVGGVVSVFGALFGGLFIIFVPVISTDINEALTGVIYGLILMIIIYAMPEGIVGRISKHLRK